VTRGGGDGDGDGDSASNGFSGGGVDGLYSISYPFSVPALVLVRSTTIGIGQCLMTVAAMEKVGSFVGDGDRATGPTVKFNIPGNGGGEGGAGSRVREERGMNRL